MNPARWRILVPAVVALGYLAVYLARLSNDPEVRASIRWAVRSWIVPPDSDASWEQD